MSTPPRIDSPPTTRCPARCRTPSHAMSFHLSATPSSPLRPRRGRTTKSHKRPHLLAHARGTRAPLLAKMHTMSPTSAHPPIRIASRFLHPKPCRRPRLHSPPRPLPHLRRPACPRSSHRRWHHRSECCSDLPLRRESSRCPSRHPQQPRHSLRGQSAPATSTHRHPRVTQSDLFRPPSSCRRLILRANSAVQRLAAASAPATPSLRPAQPRPARAASTESLRPAQSRRTPLLEAGQSGTRPSPPIAPATLDPSPTPGPRPARPQPARLKRSPPARRSPRPYQSVPMPLARTRPHRGHNRYKTATHAQSLFALTSRDRVRSSSTLVSENKGSTKRSWGASQGRSTHLHAPSDTASRREIKRVCQHHPNRDPGSMASHTSPFQMNLEQDARSSRRLVHFSRFG